ncbi:MAG: addiction module protein [Lentisphaeraceae bacterium]|nr:addiction module protein [Lentisphaeraceae bacterium]
MDTSTLNKLNTQEKLRLMEQLWTDLYDYSKSQSTPKWHGDVLNKRKELINSGKATFISLDDLKKELS